MKFRIITFGCKLNQAEAEKMAAVLVGRAFGLAKRNQSPDLIILNVCAVTHKAVREGRQKVAELKRQYPKVKIIVTGCVDESDWIGVDSWVRDKDKILEEVEKLSCEIRQGWYLDEIGTMSQGKAGYRADHKVRTLIKIQEGCDNFCAYCIVPLMRGKPKSVGVEEILKEIKAKEKSGYKEVVLTGVNIGLYSNDQCPASSSKIDLTGLLKIILNNTTMPRIRLSSLWPTDFSSELINLMAKNSRICPHVHLSAQSGSDRILDSMGRSYTRESMIQITKQAKLKIAKLNLTGDMIVGFPGETEQDFKDTCDLVEEIGFTKVHIFKYSKRPKTKASKMPDQIPEKIKKLRSQILGKVNQGVYGRVIDDFLGEPFMVLWESKKDGFYYGLTENYIRIRGKEGELNQVSPVVLEKGMLLNKENE